METRADCRVTFRSYATVANFARRAREMLGVERYRKFNVVEAIRKLINKEFLRELGVLKLRLFDDDDPENVCDYKAYVTYNPLALHVHREIWELGEAGEPLSRFIISHELGHILMHRDYRRPFTDDEKAGRRFISPEERAEDQANLFAALFLAPDELASECRTAIQLCNEYDYPGDFAQIRIQLLERRKVLYTGEACPVCANFTLVRTGIRLRCRTCGDTIDSE